MSEDIKKGLLGIVVDETEVSKVMPEINSLTYRGYAAQDLCEYCRFEEVAYLILNKDLPNTIQLRKFEKEEKNNRELSKDLYSILKKMPKKAHPMDVARTAVSIMGLEDKETTDSSPEANMRKAIRILAKTPTALAAFYRLRKGKTIIKPKKDLNIAENFFYMCFGKVPQKEIVKAFDVSLILYAEHSFNVSTFTARTITSSLSDIHGAYTRSNNKEVRDDLERVYNYFPRLRDRRTSLAGYTSGGEQQMIAIGRALMAHPTMILLDEPSMGLAPQLVKQIFEIVAEINRKEGVTILLAEQNTNVALQYAEYAYILENGRVVMEGSAESMRDNEDVKEFYLGISGEGRQSFKDVKQYRRRKRWL